MATRFAKIVVYAALLALPTQQLKSVSETTAAVCALGGGALAGGLAGYGVYSLAQADQWGEGNRLLGTGAATAVAGFLTGWMIYSIMSMYTPTARFAHAQALVAELLRDGLLMGDKTNRHQVVSRVTSMYGTSWPLVAARESIMFSSMRLGEAASELEAAYLEASASPAGYPGIMQGYHPLRADIALVYGNIEQLLTLITTDERYDDQVGLYERHMEQVRQREHERRLQREQLAHDSWERDEDRRHDAGERKKERNYKRKENKEDRKLLASKPSSKVSFKMGSR